MRRLVSLSIALALWPLAGQTMELFDGELVLRGFGTLSGTHTDSDSVGYRQFFQPRVKPGEWAFDNDSLLALQMDAGPHRDLSATLQVVATNDHRGRFAPRLEWAFIKYDLTPQLRLVGGRMLTPVFMESEYRFARYALTPVRVSQQVYAVYPISKHDGASVRWSAPWAGGQLGIETWLGTDDFDVAADPDGLERSYRSDRISGIATSWQGAQWLFRASYSYADKVMLAGPGYAALERLPPALALAQTLGCARCAEVGEAFERSRAGTASYEVATVGTRGRFGPWTVTGEAATSRTTGVFGEMSAAQVTVERRFGDWVPYVSASALRIHGNEKGRLTPVGPAPVAGAVRRANLIYEGNDTSRNSFAVGVRWDVMPSVALKAEVEHHDFRSALFCTGTSPLASSANCLDDPPRDRRFNLFTLSADFVF